jgi:hypothetical protein
LPAGLEPYQEFLNLLMAKERSERFRNVESLLHYIVALKHSIATQANGGTVAGSGLELTQERMPPEKPHVTRIQLVSGRGITNRKILLIVMTVCVAGYGGLLIAERRLREPELPNLVPISAHIEVIAAPSEPAVLQPGGAEPQAAKVRGALQWLGRHSLNEYRLTAPPQDNAYYYFSRLLQMDPNNAVAREGLLDVAARYAILAEREIANDNHRTATTYISLGLQVDPDNAALQALRDLTAPIHHGVLASLLRLFR